MTLMKSLLLGSAAAFAVAGAAQASDLLPTKKSAPAQYVKICTIDGMTGFTLPGSDTCLKISGHVHVELGPVGYSDQWSQGGAFGVVQYNKNVANTRNSFGWFTRARIQFDARSATAYGTLRSFASLDFTHTSNNAIAGSNGDGTDIDKAFIQWAGLTVGRAQSFYDFYAGDYEDAGGSDITVSTLAYTASFGGGMSATLALENNRDRLVNGFAWNNNGVAFDGLTARTNQIPDVIGVFRVDQGWGSAQLSAAMHNVNLVDGAGINVSKTGFAVQGGVKFNVPSMGAGDAFWLQAAYASAALSYIGVGGGPQDILGNGFNHTDGDVVIDGGTAAAPNVRSSSGFSVLGAFEHHFGPTFWVAPYIGYLNVSYGNAPAAGAGFPLQTNWNQIIAGVDTHWDPVTNLDFNLLLRYSHLNQGTPGGTVVPVTLPAGTAFKANTDTFFVRLNIERDF